MTREIAAQHTSGARSKNPTGVLFNRATQPRIGDGLAGSTHVMTSGQNVSIDSVERVLVAAGFERLGEIIDPEDGLVWGWTLERTTP